MGVVIGAGRGLYLYWSSGCTRAWAGLVGDVVTAVLRRGRGHRPVHDRLAVLYGVMALRKVVGSGRGRACTPSVLAAIVDGHGGYGSCEGKRACLACSWCRGERAGGRREQGGGWSRGTGWRSPRRSPAWQTRKGRGCPGVSTVVLWSGRAWAVAVEWGRASGQGWRGRCSW